jgi:catechol 2,3-dioxygenase-like lactoylglutathione lyase family enzyme
MTMVHHTALITADVEASPRFWRDGLGFEVLMQGDFDGDWPALFGADTKRLHSVFLGAPDRGDAGIVELVAFEGVGGEGVGGEGVGRDGVADDRAPLTTGLFLVSLSAELDTVLPRLEQLGLGGAPRVTEVAPGVRLCTVVDPNGVLVELMDGAQL